MTEKVALLIPTTSKGKNNWKNIKDSFLFNNTIKTFLLTKCDEYLYEFYIGYDNNDRIFSLKQNQNIIHNLEKVFKNCSFHFIEFEKSITKGHLTVMWNILFQNAYNNSNNYFYQCGDDISFQTKNWIKDSIQILHENNGIGISGPLNNNCRILTQVMVSRKHMEIFGWFFPEEIINWCCDDWYNLLYREKHFFPLKNHYCSNDGGTPRYIINNDNNFNNNKLKMLRENVNLLVIKHKKILDDYLLLQ